MIMQILTATLVAGLILMVEHLMVRILEGGKKVDVLWRYIMGVAALVFPLSVLFYGWEDWNALIALWSVVIGGGSAVILLRWLFHWIELKRRVKIAEEEANFLRPSDGEIES